MVKSVLSALALLMLATPALSVCGIHSFTACEDKIVHWFDPLTGEICDPLDCGGGRAPPKTDVPGCPQYKGTATRPTSASYLSCWKPPVASSATTAGTPSSNVESQTSTTAAVSSSVTPSPGSGEGSSGGSGTTVSPSGSVTSSTNAPLTTQPPAGGASSVSVASTSSTTTATGNAGNVVGGSLMAVVAGAALGVVALA
ncbi:hypothetical protein B0H63DRAFT_545813 [Podospora didyma]|uniref:Siderophore biosynthesis enzyme n=1 Tax=Podospora didyma TaxID=330526 RepID=A0AAE0NGT4_9PEZI|nr:hypothetical protein B0H63DRAFT_545813 [Podospora didyma]